MRRDLREVGVREGFWGVGGEVAVHGCCACESANRGDECAVMGSIGGCEERQPVGTVVLGRVAAFQQRRGGANI